MTDITSSLLTPRERSEQDRVLLRDAQRRAVLCVASCASDVEDLIELLDILGLDPRWGKGMFEDDGGDDRPVTFVSVSPAFNPKSRR